MNRKLFILLIIAAIAAAGLAGWLLFKYQWQIASSLSEDFNLGFLNQKSSENSTTTEDEIAALKKEIEELKKRPAQEVLKTDLTLASPSPAPDLKTQAELETAKQNISSLQQQLKVLQSSQSSEASVSNNDTNLVQSWRASEKVAQVACQNEYLGTWQLGSGVLISEDGKMLTNQHVVQLSNGLTPNYCLILFSKDYDAAAQSYKREYRATVSGYFNERDAALLKIQDVIYKDASGQVQNAPILNSFQYFRPAAGQYQVGDTVYIFGFPESASFNFSATRGIVSNLSSDGIYFGTDAQIDRGNSGGAAVNAAGELIGLPTYRYAGSGDYRGYILDIHSLNLNF